MEGKQADKGDGRAAEQCLKDWFEQWVLVQNTKGGWSMDQQWSAKRTDGMGVVITAGSEILQLCDFIKRL